MVEISSKIEKSVINEMPVVVFPGTIEVIDVPERVDAAVASLRKESVVGFDTETRPSFRKGIVHKVSLLQLSTHNESYLFRLNRIGIPDSLAAFLADESVKKIGLSVKDDFHALRARTDVTPSGFVEIQALCGEMGIEEKGLQKIYALLFGEKISKSQQCSNWEAETLSESQCSYASIDAWACVRIYDYLEELKKNGEYRIIKINNEESNTEER